MLWTIAVILLILWLLGFSFHDGGGLIHVILVIVVIVVIVRLVTGRSVGLSRLAQKCEDEPLPVPFVGVFTICESNRNTSKRVLGTRKDLAEVYIGGNGNSP